MLETPAESKTAATVLQFSLPPVMAIDFSPLSDALGSHLYERIADICDNLMLQVSAHGVEFQNEWPYAIHLLGHLYVNDTNSARFLWKRIPVVVKESQPEVRAAWKIGQKLWMRDHAGVHEALREFTWSSEVHAIVAAFSEIYTKRIFDLLLSAYSTISIEDTAHFIGMNEDDATRYAVEQGWTVEPSSKMLIVKKQTVVAGQRLESSKLQRLTEYVFHLEH